MRKSLSTKIYIGAFLLLLILPFIQSSTHMFSEPSLGGYIPPAVKPAWSFSNVLNDKYQSKLELYITRTYGFRSWFIKSYNQYRFSFFKKVKADGTIVCKDNFLIGQGYINAYNGTNYIGEKAVVDKVSKIKFLADTLKSLNKGILIVVASSKGTFCSEYIPDHLINKQDTSNYSSYVHQFVKHHVDFIDFNRAFLEWKDTSQYPLYAKQGVHWSQYGGYLVVDSLLKYMHVKTRLNLPKMQLTNLEICEAKAFDIDIYKSLNLLFKISDDKYAYPKVSFDKANKDSMKVLFVGDSFFYSMNATGFLYNAFYDSEFWFYNKGRFKEEPFTKLELIEFKNQTLAFDYIVLVVNEGTLHTFGWRFINDLYKVYFDNNVY